KSQQRKPPRVLWFRGLTAGSYHARRAWSGPVLTTTRVSLPERLAPTSLSVAGGEKWLITGPNGSGKSTLLHLLAGDMQPGSGAVHAQAALRIGLLDQVGPPPAPPL